MIFKRLKDCWLLLAEITHFVQHVLFLVLRLGFLKLAAAVGIPIHYYYSGNQGVHSLSLALSVVSSAKEKCRDRRAETDNHYTSWSQRLNAHQQIAEDFLVQ